MINDYMIFLLLLIHFKKTFHSFIYFKKKKIISLLSFKNLFLVERTQKFAFIVLSHKINE